MDPLKVLIVDDEPGIRSGIERVLKGYSVEFPFLEEDFTFELIQVDTGEKALEYIDSTKLDIILLDNKLPGIQGIEVLEYINQNQIEVEVMMITSYANLELAIKSTNQGAFNFMPKPFTPQELRSSIEAITKHLYLKRMSRNLNETGKDTRFQFLSVLSHELKSPINAVEGYLNIMQEKQLGNNLDDYITMIDRSLIRIKGMRNLILDLLDINRLESGMKKREIKKIDVVEVVRISKDAAEPLAIQKNVKIILDVPDELFINADFNEMEIIFNNLLSNAIKYNKENGKVYVTLLKTTDEVKIAVEDTGIGIEKDDIPKLFDQFGRIKNEKTKDISGTGLGLSILKKIVELYKGVIKVESEPEKGTKFTIVFKV